MTSIAEKIARLRALKQETASIRQEVSNAKAKIVAASARNTEYQQFTNESGLVNSQKIEPDIAAAIQAQATEVIRAKQQEATAALQRKQHVDAMIASIMESMPQIDYEAEAARLILRDGKTNLAAAISRNSHIDRSSNSNNSEHDEDTWIHTNANNIKRITVHDGPDDTTDGELTDLSDDESDIGSYDSSDGIEIDQSQYPNLDPIRTRPATPELDNMANQLTDAEIQAYVHKEYNRSIKIVKCWCIMSNNVGYQLFNSAEVDVVKKHLVNYQLIPLLDRAAIDRIEWQGMFIQWLYIDATSGNGGRCRFGRGWVLQYYPNYYSKGNSPPRLVVSTRYQPDFTNDSRTSAIYASGYTQSVALDGNTPVFRRITAGDVVLDLHGCY